ncbi:uncharacterized protein LOC143826361 isoform X2 [Paroedura picta]|uniref:uncharacterized protein LOC143826361 isoform X2 n=1 Tax=Paroedura picta TaxID=143630 RepID=UPI0040575FDF
MKELALSIISVLSMAVYWWMDNSISIVGSVNPTNVRIGEDVILSCQVRNCKSPNLTVHLYKWEGSENKTVYIHPNATQSSVQGSNSGEGDKNRTQKAQYINGYLEVTLNKVKAADTGQYVCALTCGHDYKEDTIHLIPGGTVNASVGEEVILPCPLIAEHELFYSKMQWRRISHGKQQTIYSYLFQNTSAVVYSEDTLGHRCTSLNGPSSRVWFGKKYRQKARVFKGNEFRNKNGYLKLKNILEEEAGTYFYSVTTNLHHKEVTFQLSVKGIQDQDIDIPMSHSSLKLYLCGLILLGLCFEKIFPSEEYTKLQRKVDKLIKEKETLIEEKEKLIKEKEKYIEEKDNLKFKYDRLKAEKEFLEAHFHRDKPNEENCQCQRDKEEFQKLQREVEIIKADEEFSDARFYRKNVAFDPETAHPRLEISEDGKCVEDTGNVAHVSKSKTRFDSHIFILAKDGFSKGKRYWEVEVGQKKNWVLGVASESICRTGIITLSPQKGFWVIKHEDGKEYWAQESCFSVKGNEKPTKIGIFLDIPNKSLVFYDAQRKIKLHSLTDVISGKLYPFFSTGLETDGLPLRISSTF